MKLSEMKLWKGAYTVSSLCYMDNLKHNLENGMLLYLCTEKHTMMYNTIRQYTYKRTRSI